MAEEAKQAKARCLTCDTVVENDPRRVTGCGCDPDAPTWVYIEPDGRIRGLSAAKWEAL